MTPETIAEARRVVGMIREDCENDAKRRDGMPMTGKVVGEAFGETLAIVDALARIVDLLLEEREAAAT